MVSFESKPEESDRGKKTTEGISSKTCLGYADTESVIFMKIYNFINFADTRALIVSICMPFYCKMGK